MSTLVAQRIGPFELGAAQPQWGPGWFLGRLVEDGDELPAKSLVRASLTGEGPSLALEGAQRRRLKSEHVPALLRVGFDEGRAWLCFRSVAAVPIEQFLDAPLPVDFALAVALDLVDALGALDHARYRRGSDDETVEAPVVPSFDELLVDKTGSLVVTTPPPGTRMMQPGLLKIARRDRFLLAPSTTSALEHSTVYAVGAVLHQLITAADPFDAQPGNERAVFRSPRDLVDDIPARVDDLVRRAMNADARERIESLDEMRAALARAADDFPPLDDDARAAVLRERAGWRFDQAERLLT